MTISITPPAGSAATSSSLTTVTNAGIFAVQITSLPSLAVGSVVSVSGLTSASVTVSNLVSTLTTVTNAGTFMIQAQDAAGNDVVTSIAKPSSAERGVIVRVVDGVIISITNGTVLSVSGLTSATVSLSGGTIVSISDGATIIIGKPTNYWSFTSTFTSAQTNFILINIPSSFTALHLTDFLFSNSTTQGDLSLIESRPNAAIKVKVPDTYLMHRGGAVMNLVTPIVLDTNSALCFTSHSVTAHSVLVVGYTK